MTYYPPKPILRLGYQGTLQLSTWRTRGLEDLLDLLREELETALDQEKENAQGNERPMKTKFQSIGKRYRFYMSNLRKRKVCNLPTNVQVNFTSLNFIELTKDAHIACVTFFTDLSLASKSVL